MLGVSYLVKYLIVRCPKCGNVSAVMIGRKTKQCPYCGTRFEVYRAQILARARDGKEARELIIKFKQSSSL